MMIVLSVLLTICGIAQVANAAARLGAPPWPLMSWVCIALSYSWTLTWVLSRQ